jgi:hypothetical protein
MPRACASSGRSPGSPGGVRRRESLNRVSCGHLSRVYRWAQDIRGSFLTSFVDVQPANWLRSLHTCVGPGRCWPRSPAARAGGDARHAPGSEATPRPRQPGAAARRRVRGRAKIPRRPRPVRAPARPRHGWRLRGGRRRAALPGRAEAHTRRMAVLAQVDRVLAPVDGDDDLDTAPALPAGSRRVGAAQPGSSPPRPGGAAGFIGAASRPQPPAPGHAPQVCRMHPVEPRKCSRSLPDIECRSGPQSRVLMESRLPVHLRPEALHIDPATVMPENH